MAKVDKITTILKHAEGIDEKTLEGLMKLGNSPNIKHLFEAIRIVKYGILRDEFSYPEANPVKNSVNKAFYKGGDYFLTLLVRLINKSPEMMDKIEEEREK